MAKTAQDPTVQAKEVIFSNFVRRFITLVLNRLGSPVLEETKYFLLTITLSLLKKARVLNVDNLAFFIKNYKYRESETTAIVQPFHQSFALCLFLLALGLARIVIHMDILEVLVNDFSDGSIFGDKVSKP